MAEIDSFCIDGWEARLVGQSPYQVPVSGVAESAPGAVHPVIEVFGPDATFSSAELNDPQLNQLADSVDPTGANAACVTAEGVFDMHGNLNEWTSDIGGTYRGGYYVEAVINGPGCLYATTVNNLFHHDYSTGFRCCAELGFAPPIPATGSRSSWFPIAILAATLLIAGLCVEFARGEPRREASRD